MYILTFIQGKLWLFDKVANTEMIILKTPSRRSFYAIVSNVKVICNYYYK